MTTIAALTGKVSIEGMSKAQSDLKSMSKGTQEAGGGLKSLIGQGLAFGAGALGISSVGSAFGFVKDQLGEMLSAGKQANQMDSILAAGLRSTHDASGQTMQSLDALSTTLTTHTGITDDATKAAEQMLLTFTGIGPQAFGPATQAVADMATRLNNGAIPSAQQMSQTALQLGKALNDPAQGLQALRREGVTFTQAQQDQIKAMVKAGDTAGAQKLMLQELSKEFGGSAAAAGKANGGMAIMSATMDDAKQKIGQALVPAVSTLTATFAPLVVTLAERLAPIITQLSDYIKTHQAVLLVLAGIIGGVLLAVTIAWAASVIAATWPVLAIMAAVAALTAGVIYAYNHWGFFKTAVDAARTELGIIWGFVQNNVLPMLGNLAGKVGQAKDRFGDFLGVLGHIKDAIGNLLGKLGNLKDAVGNALSGLSKIPGVGGLLPHLASGGFTPAGPFIGAEEGPELLVKPGVYAAPPGSRVYSASDTAAMLSAGAMPLPAGVAGGAPGSAGSSGYGGPQTLIVQIAGRTVAQLLWPDLIKEARRSAGLRF